MKVFVRQNFLKFRLKNVILGKLYVNIPNFIVVLFILKIIGGLPA